MGEWGFLSSLLDAVQEHSPMVGRFWLVVMLIFRILILATVGSDVFDDEQEEFDCNTRQVGCKQICYDLAFPISHYRFWVFHIVVLSAPAVLFVIYSMHQTTKINRAQEEGEEEGSDKAGPKGQAPFRLQPSQRTQHIQNFYIVNVVVRILAEIGFLIGQWMLYGFRVGYQYICKHPMCPHLIDCFVSRPTEKTIFIQFYFMVGLVSALLSLAELAHLLFKGRCQCRRRRTIAPPAPASYEQQDNWSNQKHEKSQHFLGTANDGANGTPARDGIPHCYEPPARFHHKSSTKSSRSSRSSARADLTV
ncbi:PREDICTED: gap junction delta-3 protein [Gekko japonicus]|uniref:Gap junction delta-3 protein n=1 Tax=Gekko japonicus TaxID=146911 RepID=A0ABM1JU05_GEKJA|nr:PREDICTED: gap junction delta-3 protein [Gekko japonicus]